VYIGSARHRSLNGRSYVKRIHVNRISHFCSRLLCSPAARYRVIHIMQTLLHLLLLLWCAAAQVPLQNELFEIQAYHRKLREDVQPTASNMLLMSYSFELERLAQEWLEHCTLVQPNTTTYPHYNNTASFLIPVNADKPTYPQMLRFLHTQKSIYTFENDTCKGYCGDYKQVTWASSVAVGCAMKTCRKVSDKSSSPHVFAMCLYKPARRTSLERPYKAGPSCSMCPHGHICYRNQCQREARGPPLTRQNETNVELGSPTSASTMISALAILLVTMHLL
uniref:SCP domain-containing protein n=1 Tax=Mesocestoides corti TaxID=53468 RepID=A0A5K3FQ50_MESCO